MTDLFNRNFDTETISVRADVHPQTDEVDAMLAKARQEGFDAGRRVGKSDAQIEFEAGEANRLSLERQEICAQLSKLVVAEGAEALKAEHDIVEMFLGIADRIVPELLSKYGSDLAVARIIESVKQARTDPVLSINAHPDVIQRLEDLGESWRERISFPVQIKVTGDPRMARGAATVCWKGGRLNYDITAAALAVQEALEAAAKQLNKINTKAE